MDAACSTPATSSATESSAVAIGGTAGGLLSIFAIVFGIVSWRAYKRSIAPIDFKAKLQELVAAGEIDARSDDAVAPDLPREILRAYLTKMELLGMFSSVFIPRILPPPPPTHAHRRHCPGHCMEVDANLRTALF
jgi:hypothetical protein